MSTIKENILNNCLDLKELNKDLKENKLHVKEYNTYIEFYRDMLNSYRENDIVSTTSLFNTLSQSGYLIDHVANGRKTKINDILE